MKLRSPETELKDKEFIYIYIERLKTNLYVLARRGKEGYVLVRRGKEGWLYVADYLVIYQSTSPETETAFDSRK